MSRRLGVDEKREREKQVVSKMIDLYCHKSIRPRARFAPTARL